MTMIRTACAAAAFLLVTAATGASAPLGDAEQIARALNDGCKAVLAKDVDGMMAPFDKTAALTMFDFGTPRSRDWAQLRAADEDFVREAPKDGFCVYREIHPVMLGPDAAYSWAIMSAGGTMKNGLKMAITIRSTDIWRKINGVWKIVHEHNSVPVDMKTGIPDLQSRP